ncbi:unnamed protein product [Durusdinium trenchii]|uniref:Apple domain-containing protein n=1 Tax=Durusdinium trenchii TaxID=1381693 RepID=A0ABP0RYS3_9DINO
MADSQPPDLRPSGTGSDFDPTWSKDPVEEMRQPLLQPEAAAMEPSQTWHQSQADINMALDRAAAALEKLSASNPRTFEGPTSPTTFHSIATPGSSQRNSFVFQESEWEKHQVVPVTTYHSIATPAGSQRNSQVFQDEPKHQENCHREAEQGESSIDEPDDNRGNRRNRRSRSKRSRRSRRPIKEACCGERRCVEARHVHCFQLCCARLTCSWCLKGSLLVLAVNYIFLSGPLSQPLWIPISTKYACESNDDGNGPKLVAHKKDLSGGLHACETLCNQHPGCQAIDWYNTTRWCNLYAVPCLKPTANWDGASSYQKAVVCQLSNGTSGVLIGGQCHVGIHVPSMSSVVVQEVPAMLSSWRSWSMTLLVTLIYCYMMSEWCREKLRPAVKVATWPIVTPIRSTYQGGIARKVGVLVLLIAAWAAGTFRYWGLPPHPEKVARGEVPELPLMEWGWLGISLLALLLLLCKGFRACILSTVVAIGSCIMSVFATACTTAASLCFESSLLADAAVMGGGAAVAAEGAAGATAVAEAGATVEATAAADAALGVEGTAAADVVLGVASSRIHFRAELWLEGCHGKTEVLKDGVTNNELSQRRHRF